MVQHHNSTEHAAENTVSQTGRNQLPELKLPSLKSMYIVEGRAFMHN